ncbi:MAG: SpoIID/LytB domain-containing protein [Candidatus Omnitrophota bacterium]
MRRAAVITCVLLSVLYAGRAPQAIPDTGQSVLRVLVIDNRPRISLVIKGPYKVYAPNSERVVMEGPRLRAGVTGSRGNILIGAKEIMLPAVKVKAYKDADIYVDGKRFRGNVHIALKDDLSIMVINEIGVEDYLYGVLYHEVSHKWPMEVLKAQAIAARTFALYQKSQNRLQPYDLRNDIYSQVYGGRASEKWATTRAVDLTKDKVLAYKGKIFPAYYHATCAGYTEDASVLWNIDLPPLKGGPCLYCRNSPHYEWTTDIPLWELKNRLSAGGYNIGEISSVKVLSKNGSGRVEQVEIKDEADTSVMLKGKDFRQMLGPNELRSTKFDLSLKWGTLVFKGSGWGHGVGMCQWGAFGMSRKGKKVEEILSYYYPGAEITTTDKLR